MKLQLVPSDHPALTTVSESVGLHEIDALIALYPTVKQFMEEHNGQGIAANQLGITKRWFIFQDGLAINPHIRHHGAESQIDRERCLSFAAGTSKLIERWRVIDVSYINHKGETVNATLRSMKARCFQHELDHLDGITILNKSSVFQKVKVST